MAPRRVDCSRNRRLPGFTLIELLVIMGIIALLLGLLLPALGRAHKGGWKAASMSNMRQINIASGAYRLDNRGLMPITNTYQRGIAPSAAYPFPGPSTGFQFGGKNCDAAWTQHPDLGDAHDIEAADRPLNPYLYSEIIIYAPDAPAKLGANDPTRRSLQLPVYRDPSDQASYMFSGMWLIATAPIPNARSCYDDVGTSYLSNSVLPRQLDEHFDPAPNWRVSAIAYTVQRMRLADEHEASRFVWLQDQPALIVSFNINATYRLTNGYGDVNKGLMGFLDGHVSYLPIRPGNSGAVGSPENGHSNPDYSLIFDDLRAP